MSVTARTPNYRCCAWKKSVTRACVRPNNLQFVNSPQMMLCKQMILSVRLRFELWADAHITSACHTDRATYRSTPRSRPPSYVCVAATIWTAPTLQPVESFKLCMCYCKHAATCAQFATRRIETIQAHGKIPFYLRQLWTEAQ